MGIVPPPQSEAVGHTFQFHPRPPPPPPKAEEEAGPSTSRRAPLHAANGMGPPAVWVWYGMVFALRSWRLQAAARHPLTLPVERAGVVPPRHQHPGGGVP